ncbi:MAG: DUF4255 domain-containing protein [Lentisphaeraceae bacterium]|nr:DUF4255 domain-containing protein [Lentisphaeraceae bacterium]
MISRALNFLKDELSLYVNAKVGLNSEEKVHLVAASKNGHTTGVPENSIGITLVNIEEEKVHKNCNKAVVSQGSKLVYVNPPVSLNLYILVAANFGHYPESLKFISHVISFFQARSTFKSKAYSKLEGIEKLSLDLYSQDFDQLNSVWGMMGSSYMPSVIYKVRVVSVQDNQALLETSAVEQIHVDLSGN